MSEPQQTGHYYEALIDNVHTRINHIEKHYATKLFVFLWVAGSALASVTLLSGIIAIVRFVLADPQ